MYRLDHRDRLVDHPDHRDHLAHLHRLGRLLRENIVIIKYR